MAERRFERMPEAAPDTLQESLPAALKQDLDQIRACTGVFLSSLQGTAPRPGAEACAMEALDHWLIDDEQRRVFRTHPWDAFFLFASFFFHVIGASGIRRLDIWITRNWRRLGIADRSRADILSEIARRAAAPDWESPGIVETVPLAGEKSRVNVPLIAGCIRLWTALDVTGPWAVAAIRRHLPRNAEALVPGAPLAHALCEVGPHPFLSGTIRARIECRDAETHRALKHHERIVEKRLEEINRTVTPRFLFSDVLFEIAAVGYTPMDLKFSVDSSAALQLFMGNRFYRDKRVFLRELIQNAIDACNLRKMGTPGFRPRIRVQFNKGVRIVKIRDNGIGMDRQWIEKYFLKIGISFYQSDEIRRIHQGGRIDFSFISRFGIGFLSSFLVAKKIVIRTRKASRPGLQVTITDLHDYFDIRPARTELPVGTEVTLYLRESAIHYCRRLEYIGYLKTNIRFLTVPVLLVDDRGRKTRIGKERLAYDESEAPGRCFIARLRFRHAEGWVMAKARGHLRPLWDLEKARGGVSIFQDGIFVTQAENLLPEGARDHVVGRINLTGPDRCELSMDRNRIFWTEAMLRHVKNRLLEGLVEVTNACLAALDREGVTDPARLRILGKLADFFDVNQVDDAMHHRVGKPVRDMIEKRFRDFARTHFSYTVAVDGGAAADGYNEAWQRRILATFRKPSGVQSPIAH